MVEENCKLFVSDHVPEMFVLYFFVLLVNYFLGVVKCGCTEDVGQQTALYKLELVTDWTENRFPKHYPKWRPQAQWSTVVGRSHNVNYRLWRLGSTASDAMKLFLETGKTDRLVQEAQGSQSGILDEFYAPEIQQGAGVTESEFMADTNHTKVSVMTRIVPSPDWFVGVDSLELCPAHGGRHSWVKSIEVDLEPVDGGTDNGFTFTAPNWDTVPRTKMTRITAHFPSHPANSFYYPHKKNLPQMAHFKLTLLETYDVHHLNSATRKKPIGPVHRRTNEATSDLRLNKAHRHRHDKSESRMVESEELDFVKKEDNLDLKKLLDLSQRDTASVPSGQRRPTTTLRFLEVNNDVVTQHSSDTDLDRVFQEPKKKFRRKMKKKPKLPRPCKVSEWSEWSACSRTCSFGESFRTKRVLKHAQPGGQQCPPVRETRWCGTTRNCRAAKDYFVW